MLPLFLLSLCIFVSSYLHAMDAELLAALNQNPTPQQHCRLLKHLERVDHKEAGQAFHDFLLDQKDALFLPVFTTTGAYGALQKLAQRDSLAQHALRTVQEATKKNSFTDTMHMQLELAHKNPLAIARIADSYCKYGNQSKAYQACQLALQRSKELYAFERQECIVHVAVTLQDLVGSGNTEAAVCLDDLYTNFFKTGKAVLLQSKDSELLRSYAQKIRNYAIKTTFDSNKKRKRAEREAKGFEDIAAAVEKQQKEHQELKAKADNYKAVIKKTPEVATELYQAFRDGIPGCMQPDQGRARECAEVGVKIGLFATKKNLSLIDRLVSTLNNPSVDKLIKEIAEKQLLILAKTNWGAALQLLKIRAQKKDFVCSENIDLLNNLEPEAATVFVENGTYKALQQFVDKKDADIALSLAVGRQLFVAAHQKQNKQWYAKAERHLTYCAENDFPCSKELMLCGLMLEDQHKLQCAIEQAEIFLRSYTQAQNPTFDKETQNFISMLLHQLEQLADNGIVQAKVICGFIYGVGIKEVVKQDYTRAQQYLKREVDRQNLDAKLAQLEVQAAQASEKLQVQSAHEAFKLASSDELNQPNKERAITVLHYLETQNQPYACFYSIKFVASAREKLLLFKKGLGLINEFKFEKLNAFTQLIEEAGVYDEILKIADSGTQDNATQAQIYIDLAHFCALQSRAFVINNPKGRTQSKNLLTRAVTFFHKAEEFDKEKHEQSKELLADIMSALGDVQCEDNPQVAKIWWERARPLAALALRSHLDQKILGVNVTSRMASASSVPSPAMLEGVLMNYLTGEASTTVDESNRPTYLTAINCFRAREYQEVKQLLEPLKNDTGVWPLLGIAYTQCGEHSSAFELLNGFLRDQNNISEIMKSFAFNGLQELVSKMQTASDEQFSELLLAAKQKQDDPYLYVNYCLAIQKLVANLTVLSLEKQTKYHEALVRFEDDFIDRFFVKALQEITQNDSRYIELQDPMLKQLFKALAESFEEIKKKDTSLVVKRMDALCKFIFDFYENPAGQKTSKRVVDAIRLLKEVADLHDDPIAQYLLSQLYSEVQKKPGEARKYMQRAADNKIPYAPAILNLGMRLFLQDKLYDRAYKYFDRAKNTGQPEALHFMGAYFYLKAEQQTDDQAKLKLLGQAQEYFAQSIACDHHFSTVSQCYCIALDPHNDKLVVSAFKKIVAKLNEEIDLFVLDTIEQLKLADILENHVNGGNIQVACDLVSYYNFLIKVLVNPSGRQRAKECMQASYYKAEVGITMLYNQSKLDEANAYLDSLTFALAPSLDAVEQINKNRVLLDRLTELKTRFNPPQ